MAASASLRALLDQAIDYAGMFPPCGLALEPALRNHVNYVRSPEAWMLNGFVHSRDPMSISSRSVISKCFYRTMWILLLSKRRDPLWVSCRCFGKRSMSEQSQLLHRLPDTTPTRTRQHSVTNCEPAE